MAHIIKSPQDKKGHKITAGRRAGKPNKVTNILREAILKAAHNAGDGDRRGLTRYLTKQAKEEPVAFMGLLGRCLLPAVTNVTAPFVQNQITRIELVAARFPDQPVADEYKLVNPEPQVIEGKLNGSKH
jgi:hypothetical protein